MTKKLLLILLLSSCVQSGAALVQPTSNYTYACPEELLLRVDSGLEKLEHLTTKTKEEICQPETP